MLAFACWKAATGVALPDDFRAYLLDESPAVEFMDDYNATWWPIDRIKSIPDEFKDGSNAPGIADEAERYLFFADYLIWSYAWAICCAPGDDFGRVAVIGAPPDRFVADSFSEFVGLYIGDSRAIHG